MSEYNRIETDYFEALQYYEGDRYVTIDMWPGSDFIGHLRLTIRGLEKTPYEGGSFIFELKAFENYPFYPPGVFCHTRIWHPNIDIDKPVPTGDLWKDNVCFDIINPERIGKVDPETHASGWTPAKDLTMIFECLKLMIHCYPPFFNADDPLNYEAGYQFKEVRGVFNRKAAAWTEKYAVSEYVIQGPTGYDGDMSGDTWEAGGSPGGETTVSTDSYKTEEEGPAQEKESPQGEERAQDVEWEAGGWDDAGNNAGDGDESGNFDENEEEEEKENEEEEEKENEEEEEEIEWEE